MAPTKSHVLLAALLAVVAAIGQTPRAAEGLSIPGVGSSSLIVSGIVPCSIGSSINPALVPGFANASVQLVCGGTVVATATASSTGSFIINPMNLSLGVIASLLSGQCNVVVTTPLAACDVSLAGANGTLTAPLQLLGSGTGTGGGFFGTIGGEVFSIINGLLSFIPGLFTFA